MSIVKNTHGVACIGSYGVNSQGTRGGYEVHGCLLIELDNGNWTAINYYNDPNMYIPYKRGYYVHDELPAYMIKKNSNWFVGTKEQIEDMINRR